MVREGGDLILGAFACHVSNPVRSPVQSMVEEAQPSLWCPGSSMIECPPHEGGQGSSPGVHDLHGRETQSTLQLTCESLQVAGVNGKNQQQLQLQSLVAASRQNAVYRAWNCVVGQCEPKLIADLLLITHALRETPIERWSFKMLRQR